MGSLLIKGAQGEGYDELKSVDFFTDIKKTQNQTCFSLIMEYTYSRTFYLAGVKTSIFSIKSSHLVISLLNAFKTKIYFNNEFIPSSSVILPFTLRFLE